MAWRAGARCFNLKFIQFYPTTLYHNSSIFLISEALSGEGGVLLDDQGKEFMHQFHPDGSLAPRDVVARGIHKTMMDMGGSCVYLDISHKNSQKVKNRFPVIYEKCLEIGIDLTREAIPVVPAVLYSCGGISV